MRIERSDQFKAAYRRLTVREQKRVDQKLRLFATDPRHNSLKAQRWDDQQWYFRVSRDIRVFYSTAQDRCVLITVGHHDIERRR